jgi:putative FmdB family regulatory protein
MPLYEYQCDACGHRFEQIRKFSDPPVETCPKCGGVVQKLISAPAFQLKGTGWYVTDYAKKDSGGTASGAGSSGASGSKDAKESKSGGGEKTEKSSKTDASEKSDKSEKTSKTETTSTSSPASGSGDTKPS